MGEEGAKSQALRLSWRCAPGATAPPSATLAPSGPHGEGFTASGSVSAPVPRQEASQPLLL